MSEPIDLKVRAIDPAHVVGPDGTRYLYSAGGHVIQLATHGLSTVEKSRKVYNGWKFPWCSMRSARETGNDSGEIVNVDRLWDVGLKARQHRLPCVIPVGKAGYCDGWEVPGEMSASADLANQVVSILIGHP